MALHVALHHRTEYRYDRPVTFGPHSIRLRPAVHGRTEITAYSLSIEPVEHFVNWQQDPFGNRVARVVIPNPSDVLVVEVDLVARLVTINPFDFFLEDYAQEWGFTYEKNIARQLAPYRRPMRASERLEAYIAELNLPKGVTIDALVALNQKLWKDISYTIRMEPGVQTCEQTLVKGSGSCRDTAWLMVQIFRHLGYAARFVSGYLIQMVADQKSLDGPSGTEKDFTDLHAWTEVYLPGAGWVGLDPTSGLFAGEGHIPLACTINPGAAAPIEGGFSFEKNSPRDRAKGEFHVDMRVTRLDDTARATKPYRDDQWEAISKLGHQIDKELIANDVRLTQGGEPTFVSADDVEGAEWTIAALGPKKRVLSDELLRRMRTRFAPNGVLVHGQGKWYPGEPLPRWALSCHWRADGTPLWEDASLLADDRTPSGHGAAEAERLMQALCSELGVDPACATPAYEDAWYYAWREKQLPGNVDPLKSKLEDKQERDRLYRVFNQGLGAVAGYTLPLRRAVGAWESAAWSLRRGHLFLHPGDSPMGFRLPLDSLPWEPEKERQQVIEPDPMTPRGSLPPRRGPANEIVPGQPMTGDPSLVRTALCVEAREGILHIFLPPIAQAEDWCGLIEAIEAAAKTTQLPVQIEGYPAPRDPRLKSFAVTPDPGVIEVNVHPASNWEELESTTMALYEEARATRLRTEKFDLDGRHTGTGGGNHVTFGGETPADSPFLRNPTLLRSFLTYLHNHPSLTYLFAGQFVGPTSQAPRPDEARMTTAYELEKALELLDKPGGVAPWQTDRILRNLLMDVTGNTHRTQVSIDKLFSPDSSTGRLGLVEMRALEMPPDPRMALCQFALLRGMIASFWKEPYRAPLARWGTSLHDRWLLPYFLREDLDEIIDDLAKHDFVFDRSWFDAQEDFRFPVLGTISSRGVDIELRAAVEPWDVLGEESAAGATARYVDSSMERLQLSVRCADPGRYSVVVNGLLAPVQRVSADTSVCGVRYRAWQPPSCLHPTLGVDVPVVVDLYDNWNQRPVAGCRYHVTHPGGLSYEHFPVNAYEAETRRGVRFEAFNHTPGAYTPRTPRRNPELPLTLDLRRERL